MRFHRGAGIALAVMLTGAAFAACSSDEAEGRVIQVTQSDEGCQPASFQASAGEKITFEIVNSGSKDKEFEGVEGTKLEEVKVPPGKTRKANWTAPKQAGSAKFKCYIPGGATSFVTGEVR